VDQGDVVYEVTVLLTDIDPAMCWLYSHWGSLKNSAAKGANLRE